MSSGDPGAALTTAYLACERLAREHYENFPVASLLLPRAMRRHVAAVYAFARVADDFADEGDLPVKERHALLDDWLARLRQAVLPSPPASAAVGRAEQQPHDLLFAALGHTIRERQLPVGLFEDLVDAFRQDTVKTRYETFDELLDYCRRSANPVGRLVLRIAGHDDERMDAASDRVCTALQLTNFWQDLARDWARGRLYVPLDEMRAAGACERDLDRGLLTPAWRSVLSSLVQRTRSLFEQGRSVADLASGRLAFELKLTWLGGWRILARVEQQQYDVFARRPTLGKGDAAAIVWRAMMWSRQGERA